MEITIPRFEEDAIRSLDTSEKEREIRHIIRETVNLNPDGITIQMLYQALPFDKRTIEKHLYALQFTNEIYTVKYGRTTLYLSNLGSAEVVDRMDIDGYEYEISKVSNRFGEFILIRQSESGSIKGGLLIPKDNFEEFKKSLKIEEGKR